MRKALRISISEIDFSDPQSILIYAKGLEGMSFREVLELGIVPEGSSIESYDSKSFKGGLGNLIEERYFGYRANGDSRPDFDEAGIELKSTCYDLRKIGVKAGERLVLSMIPHDAAVAGDLESSRFWEKNARILLVWYERDKSIDRYDQRIRYVALFTPPKSDLHVIREDYRRISTLIRQGRADELSEGMTNYLGACTKGQTAEKSWRTQYYPDASGEHRLAKRRAWCFKQGYMDKVLHEYILNQRDGSEDVLSEEDLAKRTLEEAFKQKVAPYIGMSDRQIAAAVGEKYTGNKAQWVTLAYRMLGIKGNRASELEKADITVRAVRREANGTIKESKPLYTVDFLDLAQESWEESELFSICDESRFFYVVFQRSADDNELYLKGCDFWSMPSNDIEHGVKKCWSMAQNAVIQGVELRRTSRGMSNNLPGISSGGGICHMRPRADKAAYRLEDGTEIGDVAHDASPLPDGRWMTTQAFWINAGYMEQTLDKLGL